MMAVSLVLTGAIVLHVQCPFVAAFAAELRLCRIRHWVMLSTADEPRRREAVREVAIDGAETDPTCMSRYKRSIQLYGTVYEELQLSLA